MSRVNTQKFVNEQEISYEVTDNGYNIYLGEALWITQYEPYIPNKSLSYEENAIAQIDEIVEGFNTPAEEAVEE